MKPLRHGAPLLAARHAAALTLKEACQRMKPAMSVAQLSDIERGIATLALQRARELAEAYGIDAGPIVEAVLQDRLEDAGFADFRIIVTVSSR